MRRSILPAEPRYICDSYGDEVILPIDLSAGSAQEYVEDYPVGWLMAQSASLRPQPWTTAGW